MQLVYLALLICLLRLLLLQKTSLVISTKTNLLWHSTLLTVFLPELDSRLAKIKAGSDLIMNFSEDYFTNQA